MLSSESRSRQRLRPWLEAKINSGQFPGLEWVTRSQSVFKIPWKHAGKQDWSETDSLIFKEWAVHTGRFREGIDPPDWPSWKTRLRCALNKLTDIQEIRDLSSLDGNNPYRVYKFKPKQGKNDLQPTSPDKEHNVSEESSDHNEHMLQKFDSNVAGNLPTTVDDKLDSHGACPRLASDLDNIDRMDLVGAHEKMDTDEDVQIDHAADKTLDMSYNKQISSDTLEEFLKLLSKSEPNVNEMLVKLKYRHREVGCQHVKNVTGCRIAYGPIEINRLSLETYTEMYGSPDLDQIHFPQCSGLIEEAKQVEMTSDLLKFVDRGLILQMINGDIYATRKCRLVVFVSQADNPSELPIKLLRKQLPVKVFDYNNYFLPTLERALRKECPLPSADFILSFGQDWKTEKEPFNNLLISATVIHAHAYHHLTQVNYETLVSRSDEYDRYLDKFKLMQLEQLERRN